MIVGTLRLGSFLLLVVLYIVYAVGRERRYLEAGVFSSSGVLAGSECAEPGSLWHVASLKGRYFFLSRQISDLKKIAQRAFFFKSPISDLTKIAQRAIFF